MTEQELQTFKKSFHELYYKAIAHLMDKEWKDHIDKYVMIRPGIIDDKKVEFELIHTIITHLIASKSMTSRENPLTNTSRATLQTSGWMARTRVFEME